MSANEDVIRPSDAKCDEASDAEFSESPSLREWIRRVVWFNFLYLVFFHVGYILSIITYVFGLYSDPVKWQTIVWVVFLFLTVGVGITGGVHRYWTHRTYKAKLPLRIILMIMYSAAGSYPIFYWVKDHRVHHKYSETNADPYNAKRGFFHAHFGWIVQPRHPEYLRRGREVDMSDIIADPVAMFEKKYAVELRLLLCFGLPTIIPILCWNETIFHAVLLLCFIRYITIWNATSSVNSFSHIYGSRPYNKSIGPTELPIVSFFTFGEGSHNYHHTFPWDYKATESLFKHFSLTTLFINACAKLGLAYDLREASPELVEKVIRRTGYKSKNQ
ncbi:acyl-CoA Delta(11) desaturase-like isoform X2 [Athalia rosae]|uniref:acyl-CoA Delta(11) desaturase-like isoform X2 n=1 Tax=Athalia rosae TaxID=37344 RepID=UPI0020333296|nr:acyl-CoA Delta(11) desaturase-like isoform X2 [Athalia rosae]